MLTGTTVIIIFRQYTNGQCSQLDSGIRMFLKVKKLKNFF